MGSVGDQVVFNPDAEADQDFDLIVEPEGLPAWIENGQEVPAS